MTWANKSKDEMDTTKTNFPHRMFSNKITQINNTNSSTDPFCISFLWVNYFTSFFKKGIDHSIYYVSREDLSHRPFSDGRTPDGANCL